jgi:hypothetical protein
MMKRILLALALAASLGGAVLGCNSPSSTTSPSVAAPSLGTEPSVEAPSEAPSEAAPSAS